jgi:hypothetical protein
MKNNISCRPEFGHDLHSVCYYWRGVFIGMTVLYPNGDFTVTPKLRSFYNIYPQFFKSKK